MLTEQPETSAYDLVKGYWANQHRDSAGAAGQAERSPEFEAWWRRAVHNGVVPDTALPTRTHI